MKKSQKDIILSHLKLYGQISTYQAFLLYDITRLSARIYDLRNDGYIIENVKKKSKNGKHYDLYVLIK